jgi:hypothetical protein
MNFETGESSVHVPLKRDFRHLRLISLACALPDGASSGYKTKGPFFS